MELNEREKKEKLCLEILSLQADFRIKPMSMSILKKMSLAWLTDCYNQLKEAEDQSLNQRVSLKNLTLFIFN